MAVSEFHKMHGLGNDFVIIDARLTPVVMPVARVKAIADRKIGIGCDQLILLEPSPVASLKMRIFNADGGEVQACGNAARAVIMLVGGSNSIETLGGILSGKALVGGATVTLDQPRFEWQAIPLEYAMDTTAMPVGWENLQNPFSVNVGNPHVVFFVEDTETVDLQRLGPIIEHDLLFPERINVNVASIVDDNRIRLRVWERGVGITRACGTGASATAVAAISKRLVASPVTVSLDGGDLEIAWIPGGGIEMTGGATHVFTGTASWEDFG